MVHICINKHKPSGIEQLRTYVHEDGPLMNHQPRVIGPTRVEHIRQIWMLGFIAPDLICLNGTYHGQGECT